MSKLNESAIEAFAIKLFERLGYVAVHGPDIASGNGIPLVVVELKSATDENTSVKTAFQQIET